MPLKPPRRSPRPQPFDVELREMVVAVERGFPRFPPPPPPLDAKASALARAQIGPLAKHRERDIVQILCAALLWLLFAVTVIGAWAFWRSLWS